MQTLAVLFSVVRESITNFIELVREEADQALAGEWEKERVEMGKQYHKVKKALKECQGKFSVQEKLTITTQAEVNDLRRELEASHQE